MQDYEITLLSKPEKVIMYNLPPVSTSKGHYLDNWKEMIWEGGVRVVAKNDVMEVQFISRDKSVYAIAPIPSNYTEAIQKTVDSQRGFVVRLANQGKFAWVGIAFRERNDAFDFNVCFDDFEQKRDLMKNPDKYANEFKSDMDYNIKQGEKLKLDFQFDEGGVNQKTKSNKGNFGGDSGPIKLAPPPNQSGKQQQQSSQQQQNSFESFGNWGSEWSSGNNNSNKQMSQQQSQQSNNFGNFSDFNNFGNFQSFGNNNQNQNWQQQPSQQQQQSNQFQQNVWSQQQNSQQQNQFQKQQNTNLIENISNNNNTNQSNFLNQQQSQNNNKKQVQETNLLDL